IPKKGYLIANRDDKNVNEIIHGIECNLITYGINSNSDSTFIAKDIIFTKEGLPVFNVEFNNRNIGTFELNIPGEHNIYNALASIATAHILGVDPSEIKKYIKKFKGIHRRFEILGEVKGCKIIDDYAHHPAEIRATLEAAQNYPHRKIWCVFQPHTFTRTKALLNGFASSFDNADHVIITDIYAARESDTGEINSEALANKIKEHNSETDVYYMKDFDKISEYIYDNMEPGDIVLTMGAGNVYFIGQMMLNLYG
ncbi:MAG: Mur ligase family protein, partial [Alkaliphilus sp.]|nr:Mur ligase family protein [Alkaliphilus sp.]